MLYDGPYWIGFCGAPPTTGGAATEVMAGRYGPGIHCCWTGCAGAATGAGAAAGMETGAGIGAGAGIGIAGMLALVAAGMAGACIGMGMDCIGIGIVPAPAAGKSP